MSHNTHPLLLHEPLWFFFFYNSYLILQKKESLNHWENCAEERKFLPDEGLCSAEMQ